MSGVHFSGHTNSTHFTDCCEVAICRDEKYCPKCNEEVFPADHRGRHEMCMERLYGATKLRKMRANYRN